MFFLTKKKIEISIILPVYNSEEYLYRCIESILKQGFKDIEVIAVDDCSTDKSLEILKKYSKHNPILKIINHSINLGAGVARNSAIKIATGKYITFIDSDDWLGSNYLKSLYDEAEETNADIVFSNMVIAENEAEHKYAPFNYVLNKYKHNSNSIVDLPYDWRSTAPWMKLFRKEFITNNDLKFSEGVKVGEDISFSWVAYFIANKISFCENVYYYYKSMPESLDRCVNENIMDIFDTLDFTHAEYQRFDPSHLRQAQLDTLFISHVYYQFSKIVNIENINLASIYWRKSHKCLANIFPDSIIDNNYLQEQEKEYYFDVVRNPDFNLEMKNKYFLDNKRAPP